MDLALLGLTVDMPGQTEETSQLLCKDLCVQLPAALRIISVVRILVRRRTNPMPSWLINSKLFARPLPAQSVWAVIKWWELRRAPYNLIVGLAGIVGGGVSLALALAAEGRGLEVSFPDPPLFVIFLVGLYGIAANICFTGGWISELVARRIWGARADAYGEISFCFGLVFSVLLTFLPNIVFSLILAIQLILSP